MPNSYNVPRLGGTPMLDNSQKDGQQAAEAQKQAADASKQASQASQAAAKAQLDAAKAQLNAAAAAMKAATTGGPVGQALSQQAVFKARLNAFGFGGGNGPGGGSGGGNGSGNPLAALSNMLRTFQSGSRGNIGSMITGGLGPLLEGSEIGESLLAIGRFAGPVGAAAGAAVALSKGFYDLIQNITESGAAFNNLQNALGSSAQVTAQAHSIAQGAGLSDSQMGSLAASIVQKISPGGDPQAQAYAARLGVMTPGRPYAVDEGRVVTKLVDSLAKIQDMTERIRTARAVGAQDLLPYTQMSQRQRGYLASDQDTQSKVFSPQMIQDSLDFQDSIKRVSGSFTNLMAALGRPEIQNLTKILDGIGSAINLFARLISSPGVQAGIQAALAPLTAAAGLMSLLDKTVSGNAMATQASSQAALMSATQANTLAIINNTKALTNPGRYGHSDRMNGALPAAYDIGNGMALRQELAQGRGLRLGGFAA